MNSVAIALLNPIQLFSLKIQIYLNYFVYLFYMYVFLSKGISLDQRDTLNISTHSGMENTQGSLKEARTMIVNQR